jgi:DNA-binding NarL/FixJ family response regulator
MTSEENADIRVLTVDDQTPFREPSRMVVELTDGFEVVGEAVNGTEALKMVADAKPDLVLMDVQMPGIDGIETTRRIRTRRDAPLVVVMSNHESGDYDAIARDAGAIGFIPKSQFSSAALEEMWSSSNASGPIRR